MREAVTAGAVPKRSAAGFLEGRPQAVPKGRGPRSTVLTTPERQEVGWAGGAWPAWGSVQYFV